MKPAPFFLSTALLLFQTAITCAPTARAATWRYALPLAKGEAAPAVEVCALKYGKSWAYSFEQDDGPVSTLAVTQPFLAKYAWNDAPPGVAGGQDRPFVGTAAVILGSVGNSDSGLSWQQIAELKERGWGIANHSFWHSGVHWDPKLRNTPAQNRRELFWSQTFFAALIGDGRAASHFVFPNGDPNYGPFLGEFGLLAGTRTSGASPHNLLDAKLNWFNYPRAYLDEGVWSNSNDAMQEFPAAPQTGDFLIDFTHEMGADPQGANQRRWSARLDHISQTWGPKGDNSMWVAPSDEVVAYALAARAAVVKTHRGALEVTLPPGAPGSALTLKISGLSQKTRLQMPVGGTLYRRGDTAWLTTPLIGETGVAPPSPQVRRIYEGEVKDLKWEHPVAIAGVRIKRTGNLAADFALRIDAVTPDGKIENIASVSRAQLEQSWGNQLYWVLPDRPAIVARELRVTRDSGLSQMEVWAGAAGP